MRDYQKAIPDYDEAIKLNPDNEALWNDRGLAKQETYDKSGAVDDFTHAIVLKTGEEDTNALALTLENRADLYVRLGDLKKALSDYTQEIGYQLQSEILFMNLEMFRSLYPEYGDVDDTRLIDKLHRMYYPNFKDDDFRKSIEKPDGKSLNAQLPYVYLKRADVLLTLKQYHAANADYMRAQKLDTSSMKDIWRWRTPPGLKGLAIDLQSLQATDPKKVSVWVRNAAEDGTWDGQDPVEYLIDCHTLKVQASSVPSQPRAWQDPIPGSQSETIRDFFCH